MSHPLIDQLHFTRREWLRGLEGVSDDDAARHFGPMNCIGWTVGHLAWHEHRYWLERAQNQILVPTINATYGYGSPMSSPALRDTLAIWHTVTQAADPYLDRLTTAALQEELLRDGQPIGQSVGSALRRMTYHYWYHTGEIQAIRQMLGHGNLPEYVGDIETEAPYRPEM
jgi:uncharacterized damage-inducible protein DinB